MSEKTRFAVFVDLENAGGKESMLNNIIEKVKIRGDILIGRVYGYTDYYSSIKEVLLSNTFTAIPSIRYGANQKNHLDIELVIDALVIAYSNPLIDSFCIVSGDSDYTPLVGKLKSMGKFVLGISRSECASSIFINACNEFVFLESVSKSSAKSKERADTRDGGEAQDLNRHIVTILEDQADSDGFLYASELKDILLRLRPDFNEKNYGQPSFGKLMAQLEQKFGEIHAVNDNYSLKVRLVNQDGDTEMGNLTKDNWEAVFKEVLGRFKSEGFDRVNPSILKASITNKYPNFDERQIGFKKFSDLLKSLEKSKVVRIETSESKEMLVRIL